MIINSNVYFKKGFKRNSIYVYRYFGVKRFSYAGSIIKRIYEYYCGGAKNLYIEYLFFYRKEFPSYKSFLMGKYNLFEEEAEKMLSKRLYCKELGSTPDTHVKNFLEYDNMKKAIMSFLGDDSDES